ncbi:hypothetical protein L1887_24781 [Cichorium endivia]|nr:hypothetical protein L1887_24781 [Cichorium endivia]
MMVAAVSETTTRNQTRPPLLPAEKDNGITTSNKSIRPKPRQISSRYLSPSPSTSSNSNSNSSLPTLTPSRRSPSPLISRNSTTPAPKRSVSADRRRPTRPDLTLKPNNAGGGPGEASALSAATKLLVTSTRSLSVSFQGEAFSLPISKTKVTPQSPNLNSVRKGSAYRPVALQESMKLMGLIVQELGLEGLSSEDIVLKQKHSVEENLWNAWITISDLRDSVTKKRHRLQLLRQKLKLASILKAQIIFLEDWAYLDKDHSISLLGAIEALKASTLRLPVGEGATADLQSMKDAINSALDLMHLMGSSTKSLSLQVEQVNVMVAELAKVSAKEKAMLRICKDFLSILSSLKVKDCSLRTHMLQTRRA